MVVDLQLQGWCASRQPEDYTVVHIPFTEIVKIT